MNLKVNKIVNLKKVVVSCGLLLKAFGAMIRHAVLNRFVYLCSFPHLIGLLFYVQINAKYFTMM